MLTTRRWCTRNQGEADWHTQPLHAELELRVHDHAGLGCLELSTGQQNLGRWRFTMQHHVTAVRLVEQFEQHLQVLRTGVASITEPPPLCERCHAPLPPDSDDCPACEREAEAHPSTWVLLRLWRFAHPYRGQLLAGFLLTLASTGATLVPPYLTMALGAGSVTPMQMATGYAVFANGGYRVSPTLITRVGAAARITRVALGCSGGTGSKAKVSRGPPSPRPMTSPC